MADKILDVKDLTISFKTDNGLVRAVRGVSFDLEPGETLCIVGESGSGKSVTSKAIMGILANNAVIDGGSIMYRGENLLEVSEDEFHRIRGNKIGMIFQDPLSSLNPIVRIGKQITEAMLINSDKLKLMYEDIISEKQTAYRNCMSKRDINVKNIETKTNKEIAALKAKISEASKEEKAAVKKEVNGKIKTLKHEAKVKIAEFEAIAKEQLPGLKADLNAKKKEAKAQVAEYKASVNAEYKAKLAELNINLAEQLKKGDEEAIAAAKKAIEDCKFEFVNKLKITKSAAKARALEIMKEVGIPLPEKRFRQYPFEFSGGMRQRIVIAIALTASPEVLICDEPTTALDVTIQAQILELIKKIQKERNIACIFITHDLGVVANMADRVAVMYAGKIVEYGTSEEIFFDPRHPYTWALLSSIPDVDSKERLEAIPGTPPNMIYPPVGDAFALRSRYAMNIDFKQEPPCFCIVSITNLKIWWF